MTVKNGDTVKVHYTGKFENGDIFDSSVEREPLKVTIGEGMVIPGFENAILGMEINEKKTVTISPEEGYGEQSAENMIEMPKSSLPEGMEVEIGMPLHLTNNEGHTIPVMVAEILDESIKLDANHPLAGKTLVFEIELIEENIEPDKHECSCCGGCH